MREVAQLLDGAPDLLGELVDHRLGGLGVVADQVAREPQVHRERDQVLLRAVMEVALHPAPLGVRGGHDPRPGLAQLVGLLAQLVEGRLQRGVQPGVVQRQADLAGQLGEHPVVLGGERVAVRAVAPR